MPLFGKHAEVAEPVGPVTETTVVEEVPRRRSTLFGRRRSVQSVSSTDTRTTVSSPRRGLLRDEAGTGPHRGLLSRNGEDPSIVSARDRVLSAEAAEREADKALSHARAAVREAREHIKRVEREAAEEARLAKIKQNQANAISRRAQPLGRHDRA